MTIQQIKCANCGKPLSPAWRDKCHHCGTPMRVADPSAQARFDEQTRAKEAEKAAKEAEKARAMGCLPLVVAPLLLAAFVGSLSRDVVGGSDALVVAFYALVGGFVLYLIAYMQGQSDRRQQESDERRQPAAVRPARPDDDPYQ